jgi:SAM-dependent methyltransferase
MLPRLRRQPRPGDAIASYPIAVATRTIEEEERPEDGDERSFDTVPAVEINRARLAHLAGLGLPLDGRSVLDVGGGPGHLAMFFVERGCDVISTDGRSENVRRAKQLYPGLNSRQLDVEDPEAVRALGQFEIVFCFGLLYHLENPLLALRNLVAVTSDLLLIETMICDSTAPVVLLDDETFSWNQGLRGLGCRPSPSWIAMALDRIGMHHVYAPTSAPDFPDYQFEWHDDLAWQRDGHPLRCTFVASRQPLEHNTLVQLIGRS